jgi:hypothetical protein
MGLHTVTFKNKNLGHNAELKNIQKLGYGSDKNDLLRLLNTHLLPSATVASNFPVPLKTARDVFPSGRL